MSAGTAAGMIAGTGIEVGIAMINVQVLLLILAFISFILAAIDVKAPRVNLGWLGLALWVLSVLVH